MHGDADNKFNHNVETTAKFEDSDSYFAMEEYDEEWDVDADA